MPLLEERTRPALSTAAALVPQTDYWHASSSQPPVAPDFKEWNHFIITGDEFDLLVNVSLMAGGPNHPDAPLTPRLIVLFGAADGSWDGDVERFGLDQTRVEAGLPDAVLGRNSVRFADGRYRLEANLRRRDVSVALDLHPVARPLVANNVRLAPGAVMGWMAVPHLRATGVVTVGSCRYAVSDLPAYHDRNWGRVAWGGDYSWEWAGVLPDDADQPWCLVYSRFTDRIRGATLSQSVIIWRGDALVRKIYGRDLSVSHHGVLRRERVFRLPRVASLVLPGNAVDVPREIVLTAAGFGDELTIRMRFDDFGQLTVPNDRWPGLTTLSELRGRAEVEGRIGDERVGFTARCQAELNYAAS